MSDALIVDTTALGVAYDYAVRYIGEKAAIRVEDIIACYEDAKIKRCEIKLKPSWQTLANNLHEMVVKGDRDNKSVFDTIDAIINELAPKRESIDESKFAIVPLGYVRQKYDNGIHTGWTHSVRRIGKDRIVVRMTKEFPEGPTYRAPETFEFALPCVDINSIGGNGHMQSPHYIVERNGIEASGDTPEEALDNLTKIEGGKP